MRDIIDKQNTKLSEQQQKKINKIKINGLV